MFPDPGHLRRIRARHHFRNGQPAVPGAWLIALHGHEKSLVQQYFAMWNTGDASNVTDIVGADFVQHSDPPIVGPIELAAAIARRALGGPTIHILVDAVLGDGPMIMVYGRVDETLDVGSRMHTTAWTLRVDEFVREIWSYRDLQDPSD